MANDFSRVRLDPLLDFAGVELKQGGVLLDADANELVAIVDRRLRALASDVLGRATVSATTIDAFKISVAAGSLTIGTGRLYVDGLLAENHGAPSSDAADRVFDDLLGEPRFAEQIGYAAQPYLPVPPALPTAGRHLVYLDVWNREVTHLERTDLIEGAVGVDTTSRVQTVWQVRAVAEDAGTGSTCLTPDDQMPGWETIIAPSTGVLSTGTFEVAPVDDPCELPPTGGYRGLENQLYRVEIHDAGQPGAGATFKWSRENASVGSRVASMVSSGELELESLGRDDVLSIKTGDWVEIVDDVRELAQASGEMRKVTVVEATRRIQFAQPLPASMLPGSFPDSTFPDARNLRVKRWDQARRIFRTDASGTPVEVQDLDAATSTGVINLPAAGTTLLLEKGVTVTFASTGAKGFKAGDYWVFAARTADASVELLDRAPPRGIHHHFARLGIWDVGAGTVTDCRHPWPPEGGEGHDCSCTACVTEASHASGSFTIQDAVNQASQTGGTVCIGPGRFVLREAVRLISLRSVRIRGQGPATMLMATSGALLIRDCAAVGVENLAIVAIGARPAITVHTAIGLKLRELLIAVLDLTGDAPQGAAVSLEGLVLAADIATNAVFARIGVRANDPNALRDEGDPEPFLLAAALAIDDNVFLCSRQAIALDDRVLHVLGTRIIGNTAAACADTAVSVRGVGLAGSSVRISGNALSISGSGVRVSSDGVWVCENKIANTTVNDAAVGVSIVSGLGKLGASQCQILANQIRGFGRAGIEIAAPVRDLIVKLNIIERCGNGILATGSAGSLSIENNHLRDIDAAREGGTGSVVGIGAMRAASATIAGNTLRAIGTRSVQSAMRAGVMAFGVQRVRASGNEVIELAPASEFLGMAAGLLLVAPLADFEVTHNRVERDAIPASEGGGGRWSALVIADGKAVVAGTAGDVLRPVTRFGAYAAVNVGNARMLVLGGDRAYLSDVGATAVGAGASGSVLGNVFTTRGESIAVEIIATQCLFSDNRVEARANAKECVAMLSTVPIVSGNRVIGGEVSIRLTNAKAASVLGNVTSGAIVIPGGLQPPWDKLNLRI